MAPILVANSAFVHGSGMRRAKLGDHNETTGRRQKEAVSAIENLGGSVVWRKTSSPQWLVDVVGEDFLCSAEFAYLGSSGVTNAGLDHLNGLGHLKGLFLDGPQYTDAGM